VSYLNTAHHFTSQLPSSTSVRGSFQPEHDRLTIIDAQANPAEPGLSFRMSAHDDGYFETAITGFAGSTQERTERIDLVTGSGKRGQTYLYWQGDRLFELPVSYWTDGQRWINSPGYEDGTADFSRPIHPGCLECHATYIQPLSSDPATNRFARETLVTGIGCETCHGPGAEHLRLHTEASFAKAAPLQMANEAILNPAKFSRDRQVDLCALCHNGIDRESLAPAFSYRPGKTVSEYFRPLAVGLAEHPDVHGNQVGLLKRSRCYLGSAGMSCSTCHNVHAEEHLAASYSKACLNCHRWQSCGASRTLGKKIEENCIDCHMPVQPTAAIVSETAGKEVHATMRTHWIKVYPGTSPAGPAATHGAIPAGGK